MAPTYDLTAGRRKLTAGDHYSPRKVADAGEGHSAGTIWVDVEAGGGTLDVVFEDSPDGVNWSTVATPITSLALSSATFKRATIPSTTDFGGLVRFKFVVAGSGATIAAWANFKAK